MIASSVVRPVGIVHAQELRRAQDLAAVERRHLQALEALVGDALQLLVAVALRDQPEEVLDLDTARIRRRADLLQVLAHAHAERVVVLEREVRLAQVQRADVADRHQRVAAGRLGVGEDARVQVKVVVGLGLVDVARAAAGDRLQLLQLDPELRRERLGRGVELLGRERSETALVVGDLHSAASGGISPSVLEARERPLGLDDARRRRRASAPSRPRTAPGPPARSRRRAGRREPCRA